MFGFGPLEILLLLGLLVLVFGAAALPRILGTLFKTWQKVDATKRELHETVSLKSLLSRITKNRDP